MFVISCVPSYTIVLLHALTSHQRVVSGDGVDLAQLYTLLRLIRLLKLRFHVYHWNKLLPPAISFLVRKPWDLRKRFSQRNLKEQGIMFGQLELMRGFVVDLLIGNDFIQYVSQAHCFSI
jgi:hypothetical protein